MNYEMYMKKCLELAKQGLGNTSPNPLVGCVVLDKSGNEISCGYHKAYGEPHAEADALSKLNDEAQGGTLFVNLEPCNHFGKTPPCSELIIQKGIKKLVVAMTDPNPVAKGGIEKCREAGIEVIQGVLEKEALDLNEIFIKNIKSKKTFVSIKVATTIDGKIAAKTGDSKWITSEPARAEVQNIRKAYDAILTTSSTVIADNPSMTYRGEGCKKLSRVVLDRELRTDFASKIYLSDSMPVFLVVDEKLDSQKLLKVPNNITIVRCPVVDFKFDLVVLFEKLFELGICSVLVEAGGRLNSELVLKGLVDKIYHFVAPKIVADNSAISAFCGREVLKIADSIEFSLSELKLFKPDYLAIYKKL